MSRYAINNIKDKEVMTVVKNFRENLVRKKNKIIDRINRPNEVLSPLKKIVIDDKINKTLKYKKFFFFKYFIDLEITTCF